MTTARDLCQDALEAARVYRPGETASDPDIARVYLLLNRLIDSWSNESLATFAKLEQNFQLVPGQYQYTIGTGGNINGTRPLRILEGYGTAYILDDNANRYSVDVVQQDEWNLIGNVAQVNSNIPSKLFYDPQYPLGIINVFPVPTIGWTLYFDSWLQLISFTGLSTALSLPPGYHRAIASNLAIEIWPHFKPENTTPSPMLMKIAMESKGAVKRTNIKEVVAIYDPEIVSRASPTYNIHTDSASY